MFRIVSLVVAAATLGAVAAPAMAQQPAEVGYQPGALGVSAILQGNYSQAEAQLAALQGVQSDDPARLLNLGQVYQRTGRMDEAAAAYRAARDSRHPFDVVLASGKVMSTRDVALIALKRIGAQ